MRGCVLPLGFQERTIIIWVTCYRYGKHNDSQSTINFGSFDSQKRPFFNVILFVSCDLSPLLSFVHPPPSPSHVHSLDH